MTDSIPSGFTPCLDPLLQEYGPVGACVYGRVWRYAQMEHGICEASHDKIADGLNITRRTVWRWIKILCDDGYLVDLTPNVSNHAHKYKVTDKISTVIEMHSESEQCATSAQQGVIESHSHCVKGSHEERERSKEREEHKNGADAPPVILVPFQVIQETIENSTNKQAVVRRVCERLWPNKDPPSYQYVARVAGNVGGYVMLASKLVIANTQNVKGDPLAYVQGANNAKNRDNHTGLGETTGEKATTGQAAEIAAAFTAPVTDGRGSGGGGSG